MKLKASAGLRAGFTLVELIVVIGVIGLLVAIILPTLGRVREQGNSVRCAANLRSIMGGVTAYASATRGTIVPVATTTGGWWPNILADNGFLDAPQLTAAQVAAGAPPLAEGPFYCPNGIQEQVPTDIGVDLNGNSGVPANRTDTRGAMAYRAASTKSKKSIDTWYGINGSEGHSSDSGPPCRRITSATGTGDAYMRLSYVTRPGQTVMFFDGIVYHHQTVNANRVNARHMNRTQTNLAFFDGHVEAWKTADLPGGKGAAKTSDFSLSNLNAKYSAPGQPLWRLDQN